jgi:hypothetical protein
MTNRPEKANLFGEAMQRLGPAIADAWAAHKQAQGLESSQQAQGLADVASKVPVIGEQDMASLPIGGGPDLTSGTLAQAQPSQIGQFQTGINLQQPGIADTLMQYFSMPQVGLGGGMYSRPFGR